MKQNKLIQEKIDLNNILILEKEILLNLNSFQIEDFIDLQDKKHHLLKKISQQIEKGNFIYKPNELQKLSKILLNNKTLLGLKIQHIKELNQILFKINT